MNRAIADREFETIVWEKSKSVCYQDIVFFSLNDKNAADDPNTVIIATKRKNDIKWYRLNAQTDKREVIFPIQPLIQKIYSGAFDSINCVEDDWSKFSLDDNRHLLVRSDYEFIFTRALSEVVKDGKCDITQTWQGIAQALLKYYMTDDEAVEQLTDILNALDFAEYPDTFMAISQSVDVDEESLEDDVLSIAGKIYNADPSKMFPPCVAKFLLNVYDGECNLGNADAACDLGSLYYTGRIGEQNYAKAVHYYTIAANGGSRQAQENLGYCYYYGRDVGVDYEKAFHYFALGAFDGHLRSLYKIGDMYRYGLHVEKNEHEAFYIYLYCMQTLTQQATPLVGADVMMRLGDCYSEGIGTEVNYKEALNCYQKAEQLFYERLMNGDFMIRSGYEKVIRAQAEVRKKMQTELPDFDWKE